MLLWAYAFPVVLFPRQTPKGSNWVVIVFAKKNKKIKNLVPQM